MTKTLLCLVGLLLTPTSAYCASPSANLSINVVPANTSGNGCELQNHGPVRGRPKIVDGTLVADDGCLLRTTDSINPPDGPLNNGCGPSSSNLSDWQAAVNIGHYNAIRDGIWLDGPYGASGGGSGCPTMTLTQYESYFDSHISLASQVGMYLMIEDLNTVLGSPCAPEWDVNQTIWTALAQRYANNTNVIFEIQNEPDACFDGNYTELANNESTIYSLIRQYAPSTPIVLYSLANFEQPDSSGYGLINLIQNTSGVDWSNAVVGWHAYWNPVSTFQSLINEVSAAGYAMYMTEYGTCTSPAGGGYAEVDFRQLLDLLDPAVAALDNVTPITATGQTWACGDGYPDFNATFVGYIWPQD